MLETKKGIIKPIVYVGVVREEKLLLVDYVTAPNPSKAGWWIPAPGLSFGEDPNEKAKTVLMELGFSNSNLKLKSVDSFVTPGGWHLIYQYVCTVNEDIKTHKNIKSHKWVSSHELEETKDIAHGKWEVGVGKSMLTFK